KSGARRRDTETLDRLSERVNARRVAPAHGRVEGGQSKGVGDNSSGGVIDVAGESALDTDIRAGVMGEFEENHLDENLRFGPSQVGHDLSDILAGLLIRDHDQSVRFR